MSGSQDKRTKVVIALPWYTGPDECTFPLYFNLMNYFGALRERTLWRKQLGHERFMELLPNLPPLDETRGDKGRAEPTEEDWQRLGVLDLAMCNFSRTSLVGRAREHIAEKALELGYDYIFWWDDDMKFEYSTFLRLWRHQVPAVAALAFTARHPVFPVIYKILIADNDTSVERVASTIVKKLRFLQHDLEIGKTLWEKIKINFGLQVDTGNVFTREEWDYVNKVVRYLTGNKHSYSSVPVFDYPREQLISGEDIGGELAFGSGVMLTDCEVFRRIPQPWFSSTGCGED